MATKSQLAEALQRLIRPYVDAQRVVESLESVGNVEDANQINRLLRPYLDMQDLIQRLGDVGQLEQTKDELTKAIEAMRKEVEILKAEKAQQQAALQTQATDLVENAKVEAEKIMAEATAKAQFDLDSAAAKANANKAASIEAANKRIAEADAIKAEAERILTEAKVGAREAIKQRKIAEAALAEVNSQLEQARAAVSNILG